jgi:hypothetical protein
MRSVVKTVAVAARPECWFHASNKGGCPDGDQALVARNCGTSINPDQWDKTGGMRGLSQPSATPAGSLAASARLTRPSPTHLSP